MQYLVNTSGVFLGWLNGILSLLLQGKQNMKHFSDEEIKV